MERRKNICHSAVKLAILPILMTILNVVPCIAQDNSTEWDQWRGPDRDGVSKEIMGLKSWPINEMGLVWRKKAGDGFSGISISDGMIITAWDEEDSQYLLCLNSITDLILRNIPDIIEIFSEIINNIFRLNECARYIFLP